MVTSLEGQVVFVTGVCQPVDNGFLTNRGAAYQRYFEAHEEAF
jgi:hypothetical protein